MPIRSVCLVLLALVLAGPVRAAEPAVDPAARNPPPSVPLAVYDRFEVEPVVLAPGLEAHRGNVVARRYLQVDLDERVPKVLAPLNEQSTIAKFLDRSGAGVQQVAYRVDDVDAVSATLRERGVRLLYDVPKRGTAGSRVNFVHPKDAGGVLVELVEPAASH